MIDKPELVAQKRALETRFGPWTAHDYELAPGLYTLGSEPLPGYEPGGEPDDIKLRRIMQIVADHAPRPLDQLRVLDLGCLEGLYCVELGLRGVEVIGIEGREGNIAKAKFAKDVLSLDRVQLVQADVRSLTREEFGNFDVVLCLGLLYHLDAPDVVRLVRTIAGVCTGFAIFDTQVAMRPEVPTTQHGHTYWGHEWMEHDRDSSREERLAALWKSLDNETSFYFTRPSLFNLLMHAGFTSVYECSVPPEPAKEENRATILAMKGDRARLRAVPKTASVPWCDLRERFPEPHSVRRLVRRLMPARARRLLKAVRGRRNARGAAARKTREPSDDGLVPLNEVKRPRFLGLVHLASSASLPRPRIGRRRESCG